MDFLVFVQLLLPGITTGCVYALVALGFVLCANVSGVVNFAQGEYVMLGGMVGASLVDLHVPLALAIVGAALAGALLGAAQERLTLAPVRRSPPFIQITITLGVAVVIRGIALIAFGKDPLSMPGFAGDGTVDILGAVLPVQTLFVWGATALLLALMFRFLKHSDTGRAVRACSINLQAARLMGVDTERLTLVVFSVAGGIGALAGVVITPIVLASWDAGVAYGLKGFVGAILGGFRSPTIAVAGGLFIGLLEAFSAGYVSSGWKDAIVYGVLLAYLLVRGGVFIYGRASLIFSSH
ncbi:MAG TPA: branched-chain amino acid ABC transporter permease [Alphaproteobacteria bacterium]|jgi:branched-chain amino acid transport system permease protein|nr:branched-chain amino acid ABC transporter permease [Alphaproteobacteria bacterium]